uniref:Uncharacterized protein n=1 Tax=Glossina brevipalpis TaxID=37001 RepID=A0A1A9WWS2_9MUSC
MTKLVDIIYTLANVLILIEVVYAGLFDYNSDRHLHSPNIDNTYEEEPTDDPYKDYLPQVDLKAYLPPVRLTLPAESNYLMPFAEPEGTYMTFPAPVNAAFDNIETPNFDGYRYKTIRRKIYRKQS